jgi:hypothetical protein
MNRLEPESLAAGNSGPQLRSSLPAGHIGWKTLGCPLASPILLRLTLHRRRRRVLELEPVPPRPQPYRARRP